MRIAKWDNLKFMLIYFVVLGHAITIFKIDSAFFKGLQTFLYTFHMPAFFFISGLFSKKSVDARRYDKILPYLFLYIVMKIIRFLTYYLIYRKPGEIDFFFESGVPWFALTLFLCYLVTIVVSRLPRIYSLIFSVCIGVMAGYDTNLGAFLTGMRLLTFYPFFLAGYYIPVQKITEITNKKTIKILSAVMVAGVLACSFVFENQLYGKINFFKGKMGYEALKISFWGGIYRGIYYAAAFLLVIALIALTPSARCIFSQWGQRTLQVYALHYYVIRILVKIFHLKEFMSKLLPDHFAYLVPAVAFLVTVILSSGFLQPFFHWLMNPMSGKKNRSMDITGEGGAFS